jgi:hypothetical protein
MTEGGTDGLIPAEPAPGARVVGRNGDVLVGLQLGERVVWCRIGQPDGWPWAMAWKRYGPLVIEE